MWLIGDLTRLLQGPSPVIVAIDGPCGGGKSTLCAWLCKCFPDSLSFHMDDFFLKPEQRTARRLAVAGGNSDTGRFLREVLLPLRRQPSFEYHAYDCRSDTMHPVRVRTPRLAVVEGSYSMHPRLRGYYDYAVFLTIDPAEQLLRVLKRSGQQMFDRFRHEWIPMENRYFADCAVAQACDLVLDQAALCAILSGMGTLSDIGSLSRLPG